MKNQKGQVILIVLIISALILTIGLSISRKAVVETRIDTDEELLKQAFNTAESGIDYYIGTGQTNYVSPDSTKQANVTVTEIGKDQNKLDFNEYYVENSPAMFWLVAHNTNGDIDYSSNYTNSGNNLNICVPNTFNGSLKVEYYYTNGSTFGVNRTGYNFGSNPNIVNGYTDSSGTAYDSCGSGLKSVNIGVGNTSLLLSVTPIFAGAKVTLTGSGQFPSQGSEISSVGKVGDLENGVNRRVTVQNRYRVPSFLFEAITAGNSVSN